MRPSNVFLTLLLLWVTSGCLLAELSGFKKLPIAAFSSGSGDIQTVDFNKDGQLDMVSYSTLSGEISLWYRTHSTQFSRIHVGIVDDPRDLIWCDIDDDSLMDIVCYSGSTKEVILFRQTLGGGFETSSIISEVLGNSLGTGDVNADGRIDLITAGYEPDYPGSQIAWWEQMPDGSMVKHVLQELDENGVFQISFLDLDGDQRKELFVTDYKYQWNARGVLRWEQDGDGGLTSLGVGSKFKRQYLKFGDINQDGMLDVLGLSESSYVEWWEQGPSGVFTERMVDDYNHEPREGFICDFDGDGDMDIVVLTKDESLWFRQASDGSFQLLDIDYLYSAKAGDVGDFSGDGYMDLVGSMGGDLCVWVSIHNAFRKTPLPTTVTTSMDFADMDANGIQDLVFSSSGHDHIRILEWVEEDSFIRKESINNFNGANGAVFEDLNGDGYLDVIGSASYEDTISWWQINVDYPYQTETQIYAMDDAAWIGVEDMNGDGMADIVIYEGNVSGNNSGVVMLEQGANASFERKVIVEELNRLSFLDVGDINSDGLGDLIGGYKPDGLYSTTLAWWEQLPSGEYLRHDIEEDYGVASSVVIHDMDKDGKMDIVMSFLSVGNPSGVRYWRQGESGSFTETIVMDSDKQVNYLDVGDVNGDGLPDIVYVSDYSKLTYLKGVYGGGFEAVVLDTILPSARAVRILDANNDGIPDIVVSEAQPTVWFQSDAEFGGQSVLLAWHDVSLAGNQLSLQWESWIGESYQLQYSHDLSDWVDIGSVIVASENITMETLELDLPVPFFVRAKLVFPDD